MVTIVLLNVEWMWRTPSDTTRFVLRRRAGVSAAVFPAPPSVSFAMLALLLAYLVGAIFLPATVFRGPLRVRAFVCVRWPRTGRLRRWRRPR